jgi:nucleotide-binding universal stress UspA family protein
MATEIFGRILVPLDGSGEGKSVLPYIRDLSQKFNSSIYILGVGIGSKRRRVNYLLKEYINEITNELCAENIDAKPIMSYGTPAEEITLQAEKNNINLITMATHGRGGITRWWIGSVAERVVSNSTIPVFLVRSKRIDETEALKKATIKNIIAPLDGSDIGESALANAEAIALKTGASIHLLHIITPPGGLEVNLFGSDLKGIVKAMNDSAENYLNRIAEDLKKKGIPTRCKVMAGDPANLIVEEVTKQQDGLIAMSTHGRSGIARWILGSVADKVLHEATIPIWLVRSPKMIIDRHEN